MPSDEVEIVDAISDEIEIPYTYSITSYGADYPVDGLVKRIKDGSILVPVFQRGFVWDWTRASRFVEYVEDQLQFFYNPKTNRILELAGAFDPGWRTSLEAAIEDEIRDALDTIVENKNRVAHGRDSQITFAGISAYYERATRVLDLLELHCT
jgi:hypothetical protein